MKEEQGVGQERDGRGDDEANYLTRTWEISHVPCKHKRRGGSEWRGKGTGNGRDETDNTIYVQFASLLCQVSY